MSALELALRNLAAWSLQVAVLGLAASALARLFPIERPAARLAFGQVLLALVLGLPLVQPWQATSAGVTLVAPPPPSPRRPCALAVPGGAPASRHPGLARWPSPSCSSWACASG